jgi:bifunctional DNA-binding transcriptional regulator/antitoxin component of YhaV-PrlF toxin-antitoxin module
MQTRGQTNIITYLFGLTLYSRKWDFVFIRCHYRRSCRGRKNRLPPTRKRHLERLFICRLPSNNHSCWPRSPLTNRSFRDSLFTVKITRTGQVTIPSAMRRKHGMLAEAEVQLVDRPDGVLVIKAANNPRGKRAVATLLRGGKIKGRTKDWLRLTRG